MKELILSAGMPRSGSTWLYNAMRLMLKTMKGLDLGAGWIQDFQSFKNHDTVLMKLHSFEPGVVPKANFVAYSYRDIRDSLASMKRKFNSKPTIAMADKFIEDDKKWRERANFILKYEDMVGNQGAIINELSEIMKIENIDGVKIADEINKMNYKSSDNRNQIYNKENLLHDGHITAGHHGSWKEDLSDDFIQEVELKYSDWLRGNNYPISKK